MYVYVVQVVSSFHVFRLEICICFLFLLRLKMTAFWALALSSLIEVDRRFRGTVSIVWAIALMMKKVSTSETWVYFKETMRC